MLKLIVAVAAIVIGIFALFSFAPIDGVGVAQEAGLAAALAGLAALL